MSTCINTKFPAYLRLQKQSLMSETLLNAYCRTFLDKYGRFPHSDELPALNSSEVIKEDLGLTESNTVAVNKLLDKTSCNSVQEAVIKLNDTYRDLEVDVLQLNEQVVVYLEPRPNAYRELPAKDTNISKPNSIIYFESTFEKLRDLYGIQVIQTNVDELTKLGLTKLFPEMAHANAFIYNGSIYINNSFATVDAPIHELLHLLVGSMRFLNPSVYLDLLLYVTTMPEFKVYLSRHANKSLNDAAEEYLVTYAAQVLAGTSSLPEALQYELIYNINRTIDSCIMGSKSAHNVPINELMQKSIVDLAKELNSNILNVVNAGTLNDATIHRICNNVKSDLMKSGKLEQICL